MRESPPGERMRESPPGERMRVSPPGERMRESPPGERMLMLPLLAAAGPVAVRTPLTKGLAPESGRLARLLSKARLGATTTAAE